MPGDTIGAAFIAIHSDPAEFTDGLTASLQPAADKAAKAVETRFSTAAKNVSTSMKSAGDAASKSLDNISKSGAFAKLGASVKSATDDMTLKFLYASDAAKSALERINTPFVGLETSVRSVADEIELRFSLAGDVAKGALDKLTDVADVDFSAIADKAGAAAAKVGGSFVAAGDAAGKGLGKTGDLLGGIAAIGGKISLGLLAATTAVAGFGLVSAANLESTTTAFTSLLGSASAAKAEVVSLQKFAAATPFNFQDVAGYAQQFLAMHDSVGLAQNQLIPFLTTIGNLAAATGASTANIHDAILAISQIGSVGKVQLGNIEQIANAFPGFNAVSAIAVAQGKTTAQVMQEIGAGTLSAATAIPILLKGMAQFKGAAGAMNAQAYTLKGVFSTFGDTLRISLTNAFQPVIPVVKATLTQLTPVIGSVFDKLGPQIAVFLNGLAPLLAPLVTGLGQVMGAFLQVLGPALGTLAPLIGTIGTALAGIFTAVGPLVQLVAHLAAVLGPPILSVITALLPAITAFGTILSSALAPVLPVIAQAFTAVAKAIAAVLPAVKPLISVFAAGLAGALKAIAPLLPALVKAIASLAGPALKIITAEFPIVVAVFKALAPVVPILAAAIVGLVNAFLPLLPIITPIITLIGQSLVTVLKAAEPLLVSLVSAVVQIGGAILSALAPVLPIIAKAFGDIFTALQPLIPVLAGALLTVVEALAPSLPSLATSLAQVAVSMAQILVAVAPLVPPLAGIAALLIGLGAGVITGVARIIADIAGAFGKLATAIGTPLVQALKFLLNTFLTVVGAIVHGAADAFGWVPIVGSGLKGAARAFDTFKNQANQSLSQINQPPPVKVQTATAAQQIAALTNQINRIRQGNVPGIDIDTRSGMAKVQALQAQIDGLIRSEQLGASAGPLDRALARATGGAVYGPGGPTSDKAGLYRLSNGEHVMTAAEVAKMGGQAAVYRLRAAIRGGLFRGMATGGAVTPGLATGGAISTTGGNISFTVTGNPNLVVTQTGGIAKAIISSIKVGAPGVASAMKDLAAAASDAFKLRGAQNEVTTLTTRITAAQAALTNLKQQRADLATNTASSILGLFNPATAGADPATGYVASANNILGVFAKQAASQLTFGAQLRQLQAKGIDPSLLAKYAAAGPSQEVSVLASGSTTKAQIAALNYQFSLINRSASAIGGLTGSAVFDKQIQQQTKNVDALTAQQKTANAQVSALSREVAALAGAVRDLTGRAVVLQIDGKTFLTAVQKSAATTGRRK